MKILIIDDEIHQRQIIADILTDAGYEVTQAENGQCALRKFKKNPCPVVLTDLKMPGMDGRELLDAVKKQAPATQVVLMTAFGSIPGAVEAMKKGAYDYLTKPFDKENLLLTIKRAAEKYHLLAENSSLRSQLEEHRGTRHALIGKSAAMRHVFRLIDRIKDIDATVLIEGASGTGKEVLARAIHFGGIRREGPFVALNCGAIPEHLIESALFGHKKGAFTGAHQDQTGKFEQARGGTLFLDEIGTMRPDLQVRLLRVLQEKEFEPVGGRTPLKLDARIIAATNEDLKELIQKGRFREDLYHRLNVFDIRLPSLRERAEDIPLFIRFFTEKFCRQYGREIPAYTPAAMRLLQDYAWPGNVRELQHVIEKTLILNDDTVLEAGHIMLNGSTEKTPESTVTKSLPAMERTLIIRALEKNGGSISKSARELGISYKTLQYRIKKHNIRPASFKKH